MQLSVLTCSPPCSICVMKYFFFIPRYMQIISVQGDENNTGWQYRNDFAIHADVSYL